MNKFLHYFFGILLLFCGICTLVALKYVFFPSYKFTYYYSKDKKKVLTKLEFIGVTDEWGQDIYLINGFYENKKLPQSYIKPVHGFRDNFNCLLKWENNVTHIYTHDCGVADFILINIDTSALKIKELTCEEFSRLYQKSQTNLDCDVNYVE